MSREREIVVCPSCKGRGSRRYYNADARDCRMCNTKGIVIKITTVEHEKIEKLEPLQCEYKGL